MRIYLLSAFLGLMIIIGIASCGNGTGNHATAGTGGMKKVIGTSNAVAIVAVRPGMQPTNRP